MRYAVIRTTAPASTGSWDFVASGYGTCIGATFKISGGLADITVTNAARLGAGFTDGTNNRCVSFDSQNGQANTNSRRYKSVTYCAMIIDATGTVNGSASFSSFITDGIRLNVDNGFGNAFFVEARLMFSDDASEKVFVGTGDTSSGDHDITDPTFEPSYLEGFSTNQSSVDFQQTNAKFMMGFAVRNSMLSIATQASFSFYEPHAATEGQPSARMGNSYFLRDIEGSSVFGAVQIQDFDSSGFTAKQINSAGFEFYYMAVKCLNTVKLTTARSQNSTITHEHGSTGFYPLAIFGWNTKLDALNTNYEDGRAGAFGLWQSTGPSVQYNSSIAIEDNSATTDCQSTNDDSFPYLPDHDGGTTTAIIGSITAFTSLGFEVTYTNVDSVRCYFAILAIAPLSQTLSPSGISSGEAVGSNTVTPSGPTLQPSGAASGELFGSHTVAPGGVAVSPSAIASLEAFGAHVITVQGATVLPSSIASLEAFGSHTIQALAALQPSGIPSAEAFGNLVVLPGGVLIVPAGIGSEEAFGSHSLLATLNIVPTAIATAEEFGVPVIVQIADQSVSPSSIASAEAFGTLVIGIEGEGFIDYDEVKKRYRRRNRTRPIRSIIFHIPMDVNPDDPFANPTVVLPMGPFLKKR